MMSLPVWLPGPMFLPGGSVPCPMSLPGVCLWGGDLSTEEICLKVGGGLPTEKGLGRHPPEPEKRAVRILLECFLVINIGFQSTNYFVNNMYKILISARPVLI